MISRIFKLAAAALVLALLGGFGAWTYVAGRAAPMIHSSVETVPEAEAALVLGSSRLLPGGYLNPYFAYRIETAAALYASGKVRYLIVSGNQARGGRNAGGYDEPTDMRDALVELGVPAASIYRDYAGFRTLDSVLRAKSIFGQQKVILVSQRFHLERALYLAAAHGLTFSGFVARDVTLSYDLKTKAREVMARIWAVGDVLANTGARYGGPPVVLGVDAPT